MAILTIPSATSLSALVPIPAPPSEQWPSSSTAPSSSTTSSSHHEPTLASQQRLDMHHDLDTNKENKPRGRPSDTVLCLKSVKRRKTTNVVSPPPSKQGGLTFSRELQQAHQSWQMYKSTKAKRSSSSMKQFSEDYYSSLKYESSDEVKKEGKKLRFACFTQVKEIPSHRDYSSEELDNMYSNTRQIRENASRNYKEMWYDVGAGNDRESILHRALEEDSFHIYQSISGETEYIHPAIYPEWLQQQQEKEEREREAWCRENNMFLEGVFQGYDHDDEDDDDDLSNTSTPSASVVKTHEDEYSTVFRFGGTSTSTSQALQYECDYGFDTIDFDEL